jgi:NAD(P)-dependent dehydrogenase (short-subunit alcohol dehydrogenase family)
VTIRELFELDGQVALVTGGSRGLGLQIAQGLGEMGAQLALSARKRAELEDAKSRLAKHGIDALTVVNDLSQPEQVPALVEAVMQRFGRIDVLVNNAPPASSC